MSLNFTPEKKTPVGEFYYPAGCLLLFLFINDGLIAARPFFPSTIWALYDGVVHGLTGVFVLYPIYKKQANRYLIQVFLLAAVVDLDHFIAAQSLSLTDALQLPLRPGTHSITFAILVATAGFLLTRNKIVGWIVFAALASHVVRDASGGITPIFHPLKRYGIPPWLYYASEIVLLYVSFQVSRLRDYIKHG